jgi:uncharacterized cupin superfamily protein
MPHPIVNLDQLSLQSASPEEMPPGEAAQRYDLRWAEIGSRIGARKLGYNLTVIAPGKYACPFHHHLVREEMFLILAGNGELRLGQIRHPIRAGDVIACPPGDADSAHQIINTGIEELRFLAISTTESPDICLYPDSGKYGVFMTQDSHTSSFKAIGRGTDNLDYWDGE